MSRKKKGLTGPLRRDGDCPHTIEVISWAESCRLPIRRPGVLPQAERRKRPTIWLASPVAIVRRIRKLSWPTTQRLQFESLKTSD